MKKLFLVLCVGFLLCSPAKASHLMGGEITWTCITDPTVGPVGLYIFKLKVYRDCNGIPISGTMQTITVHNNPLISSINVNLVAGAPFDISPLCDPVNSGNPQMSCVSPQQGSVEEYVYESLPINLAGIPPAGGWHFTWDECCRNGAITNGFANQGFTLRAIMYPYSVAGVPQNTNPCFDSSPQFNEQPKTIICVGYPFSYSHNASDPELDSLVYEWADVLDDGFYNPAAPATLPFSAPYSVTSPIPSNLSTPPAPTLDSQSGEITYYTNISGNFVTCVKVSSFKCGQLVAEVYREIQVVLLNCPPLSSGNPNLPPAVVPPFAGGTSYFLQVTAGTLVNFNITGTDNDLYANGSAQDLTMEVSGGQFASDFVTDTLCLNPPCATFNNGAGITPPFSAPSIVSGVFNWQTSCYHIAANAGCNTTSNIYTFAIKVVDDFCPAPAIKFATITIEVVQAPFSVSPDVNCAAVDNNGDVSLTWNHQPVANPNTVYHVYSATNVNGPFSLVDSLYFPDSTYLHQGVNANVTPRFYYMTTSSDCAGMSPPSDTLSAIILDAGNNYFTCDSVQMTNGSVVGGSNLTYLWSPAAGLDDPTVFNPWATPTVSTMYSLTITTPNGCVLTDSVKVDYNVGVLNYTVNTQNVSCWDGSDGKIAVYPTGGSPPYGYYINGNLNPNPSPYDSLFTNLSVGQYNITVIDGNNCFDTGPISLVGPGYPMQVITSDSVAICYGDSNGVANAWGAGGTPPYSYDWFNAGQVSFSNNDSVSDLHVGSYFVEITDALGCDTFTTINVVQPQTALSASIQIMDVVCKGDSSGFIVATSGGSYAPYTYVWLSGSDTLRHASHPVEVTRDSLNNLPAGSYELHVYDNVGCFESYSNVVSEPTVALTSTLNKINDVDCYGDSTGAVQVVVIGGVPAYSYIWDDVAVSSSIVSNLAAGLHTVYITDDWNCTIEDTITIFENPLIVGNISIVQNVSCHGGNDGIVSVSSTGGVLGHTYDWSNGHQGLSQPDTNSGLFYGSYYVIIEDQLGCRVVDSVFISEPDVLETEATKLAHISCFGFDDGIASAVGIGGTAPFNFTWSPGGQSGDTALGLIPVVHTVNVTDAKGCTASDTVTIIEPTQLVVDIDSSQTILAYCTGVNSASLTAVASGGTRGYTYVWDDSNVLPQITATATNLFAGIYTVIVTDYRGCMATDTEDIDTITATMDARIDTQLYPGAVEVSCFGANDGMAIVSTWGAHAPYTYQWYGPNSYTATNDSIYNLFAGTYSVTISDTNNCSINRSINLTQPDALVFTTFSSSNETCLGAANGTVSIDIQGGSSPYTGIATDNNSGVVSTHLMQNDTVIPGITSGIFTISLTDANNCSSALILGGNDQQIIGTTIATYANIDPSSVVHLDCYGIPTGVATVQNPINLSNYSYSWQDIAGNSYGTDTIAENLLAGTYVLFAHYSDSLGAYPGCTTTDTVVLTQPDEIQVNPTLIKDADCFGGNDGRIQTQISGGTRFPGGPNSWYQLLWNSGQTTRNINGLTAGTYIINITDANGCLQADTFAVAEPLDLISTITPSDYNGYGISCFGGNNGVINLTIDQNTGTAPYVYTWSSGQSSLNIYNLSSGQYTVTITDAKGCTYTNSTNLTEPAQLLPSPVVSSDYFGAHISCFGAADGELTVSTIGGVQPYDILWNDGSVNSTNSGLMSGIYSVSVTDENGCIENASITLVDPVALSIDLSIRDSLTYNVSCFGICDGWALATAIGGTGSYTYAWSDGQTSALAEGLCSGSAYTITVTDANGCDQSNTTITFAQPPAFEAEVSTPNYFGPAKPPLDVTFADSTYLSTVHPMLFTWIWPDGGIEPIAWEFGESGINTSYSFTDLGENKVNLIVLNRTTGCADTIDFIIDVQGLEEINNVFTPNGDGVNDVFVFENNGMDILSVMIFNRWGQKVFETDLRSPQWDGKNLKGNDELAGTYFYVLTAQGKDGYRYEEKGALILIRE
ncbi:MAG: hypothetical protein CBC83_06395 [Flavobacteriales bacterium TMED123]|nr:MAG: hypothetical protein CBC83_06395 [Flavobacteriales bacterium TMED123]|tara:strand:- start:3169 stop:9096 length:5928 start_codon:yes stop_codon:yes gene_type:complete